MMQALEVLRLQDEATRISEEIRPVALAIFELCTSDSQSVETSVKEEILKTSMQLSAKVNANVTVFYLVHTVSICIFQGCFVLSCMCFGVMRSSLLTQSYLCGGF